MSVIKDEKQKTLNRVEYLRNMIKLSLEEFAHECKISPFSLKKMEEGEIPILESLASSMVLTMANYGIGVSNTWICNGVGPTPHALIGENLDLKNDILKNLNNLDIDPDDKSIFFVFLSTRILEKKDGLLIAQVKDNHMEHLFSKGDIVCGYKKPLAECDGKYCIIAQNNGLMLIRKVTVQNKDIILTGLQNSNVKFISARSIQIAPIMVKFHLPSKGITDEVPYMNSKSLNWDSEI